MIKRIMRVAPAAVVVWAAVTAMASPVSYWPLDGNANAVVGANGTMVGSPTATADRNGTAGGALQFAATGPTSGSYVTIPGGGGLDSQDNTTLSMWVKWNGPGQDQGALAGFHGAVTGRQNNAIWSKSIIALNGPDPATANVRWRGVSPTHTTSQFDSSVTAGDGTWRHVVITESRDWQRMYIDGQPQADAHMIDIFADNTSIPLSIGAWIGDGNSYSNSSIDDVAVWNRMLPVDQIAALANQTASPLSLPDPIPRVGARASTELIAGFNRRAANTVDGVGHGNVTPDGFPGDSRGMWLSNGTFRTPNDTDPEIAFDLGGVHQLDSLVLYNYNENQTVLLTSRGVNQAEILISEDNVTYTSLGTHTFTRAPGDGTNPGQAVSLGGVQARYVKLDNLTSHGGDNNFVGLNEVEFFGTPRERLPVGGVSVTETSSLFEGNFDRRSLHLVDATGLFADTHSVVPDGHMWLSDGIGFGGAGDDPSPQLVFDLGVHYGNLESAKIWNYNEFLPGRADLLQRGVDEMEILVSSDGVNFVSVGTINLAQAPGNNTADFSEMVDLSASHVRFVRFDVLSNHHGVSFPAAAGATDNAFVGLSEVRFSATNPEPGLVNPSFEADGDFANFPGYVVSGATRNGPITAWLPSSPNVNTLRIGVNNATQPFANNGTIPDGDHVAFIQYYVPDGVGPRSLSQMVGGFDTHSKYIVTYRENARSGSGIPNVEVSLGGTTIVGEHPAPPVGGANPYRYVGSAVFGPTSATNNLVFSAVGTTGNDGTWLIDDVAIRQVYSHFTDNFNVNSNSPTINPGPNDQPGRQSGFVGTLNYVENGPAPHQTQLGHPSDAGALFLATNAANGYVTASPDHSFTDGAGPGGTHYVVQFQVDPANQAVSGATLNDTWWSSVVFGASSQTPFVNASDGVGFLIRRNGGYQIFDGTDGTNELEDQGGPGSLSPGNNDYYDVRINYFVPGFDDQSQALVSISVEDQVIHSFQTDSGMAGNYIVLGGYGNPGSGYVYHHFDNLEVYATAIPEPATIALFAVGLIGAAGALRRRAAHA